MPKDGARNGWKHLEKMEKEKIITYNGAVSQLSSCLTVTFSRSKLTNSEASGFKKNIFGHLRAVPC